MAPKKHKRGRGQRSKTPGQTSASDPNPIATSPSGSAPTGDATTASLVPSSASPSAPPTTTTTTTTTQLIPSAPPQTTTLLPSSSPSHLTATTQPPSSAPPLPIRKTHKEPISCTSDGLITSTDLAGPSTAPSASAESTDGFFTSLFATAVEGAMAALQIAKEEDPAELQAIVENSFGLRLDDVESILDCYLGLAEHMKGDAQLKAALEAFGNVEALKSTVNVAGMMLAERKKRDGSGGSCSGGSKGDGGSPDSGSGEGDGEGGGVGV